MRRTVLPFAVAVAAPLALLAACADPGPTGAAGLPAAAKRTAPIAGPITPTLVAGGLLYPRGIAFGPDDAIYVAEAGVPAGHTLSTVGLCAQVPAPLGPLLGGHTGRISRIAPSGARTTVAAGLPSSVNQLGDVIGVTDLAFVGPKLYALMNGGCSRGMPDEPATVARIEGGAWTPTVDLSAWVRANPTENPEPGDFEPDGDWYAMIAAGGVLYLTEANQGNVARVRPNPGEVERVVDVSADQGHVVPTAIVASRGDLYVTELTPFPAVPGASEILRYRRNGTLEGTIGGFTAVLGIDADHKGNLYVLESFTCPTAAPCFPSPGSGRVTRIAPDGTRAVVAVGLSFATSLRLGPDGALYVSNFGFGPPAMGQVLRIALP
jgi:hypothetical protein